MKTSRAPADTTPEHLRALYLHTRGIAAPIACDGRYALSKPVVLHFADKTHVEVRATQYTYANAAVEALEARCAAASFGAGRRTRYDPRVRDALQLKAEGGAFTVEGFDPESSGVLEQVRAALAPDDPNPLAAELYALNIYSQGGHFVAHKDTPRGAGMIGTLVVGLPIYHWGGELELRHRGARLRFKLSDGHAREGDAGTLRWVAFFGDVDHSVEEVKSGSRVTLSWILRRGEGAVARPAPRAPRELLGGALDAAMRDPGFVREGGLLGFACHHLYGQTPGFKQAVEPLSRATVLRLKGHDQQVALAAMDQGLDVYFRPYIYENEMAEQWRLERQPTPKEMGVFSRDQLTPDEVEAALPVEVHINPEDVDPEVDWVEPVSREEDDGPVKEHLVGVDYSTTGYFGNEGGYTDFYAYGALLVSIPSYEERAPLLEPREGAAPAKPKRKRKRG